ncbi:bifunctional diguanylate cyclase/phosphodiesterase [Actinoplanes sichuanensis]|uniref:Bifunctional diguanylate cyclase/phosphodiesterase n=1 Tax=Actinoplanes sichuanensis TaxID=512349 RepID=A0ABW4AF99_9ACTN|nr:EAL domain-containing protein [Actinoplanes sichuanensis]BEL02762.1 bifunctional diguanylate cyclase/phosphodiesterase [Actinoplanes sichuanensis]
MTTPESASESRLPTGGLVPVLVAVWANIGVLVWMLIRDADDVRWGYVGGPFALAAATYAGHRVVRVAELPRPVRVFWRRMEIAAAALTITAIITLARANNNTGMSPWVAVPMLVGVGWLMTAFLGLPGPRRTALHWLRGILDTLTIAIASGLIFWYVVLDLAPAGTSLANKVVAAVVGVGGVLLLVVVGKAAAAPETVVHPAALRVLTTGPITCVAGTILLIAGGELSRLALSVLALPLTGAAICIGAYLQCRALNQPSQLSFPARSVFNMLPFVAVVATAGLVITVSAQDMTARQRVVIIGALLITGCVVARQLLSLRENTMALRGIRRQQDELERLALSDNLTGLPNRTRFLVAIGERLEAEMPVTAVLIDVDDFKMINDTIGPAAGDQLLFQVSQRLRDRCTAGEMPARLGGDEFAVLLPDGDPVAAEAAVNRLLLALADPFRVGEQQLLLHASAGIAIADTGEGADEVLRNADIAMYAAKESGKASFVRFEPRMRDEMMNHATLAGELRNGIARGELRLLYQPVFDLVTGRLHGCEALVRWQHPVRGFVSPGEFIPVAERSGLIVPLGAWVLREACEQMAQWRSQFGDGAVEAVNVNVAVRQLRSASFVDEVAAVLSDTGLTSRDVILEVTESSVVDGWQVQETLQGLHDMGVRLALDDFGTGQSSLSLLRAFPVDVLKLDKSFVDGIADGADRGRLAVAAAVAQLAEYLQLKAVAEGIENQEQLDRLRDMGYRYGQGFHMAKPLPAADCGALMAADPVNAA